MTELLVSTKKGLFVHEGEPDAGFAGEPVEYALRDRRTGRLLATITSPFYGPKVFYTEDPSGEWEQAQGVALPEDSGQALARIWLIKSGEEGRLYAGGDPGVLFESRDGGASWELNRPLWERRLVEDWQPGGGGLCLHSIAPWPGEPDKLAVGVSAAGVWLTDDGGASWRHGVRGIIPRYLPAEVIEELGLPQPDPNAAPALCIHHLERSPTRPERLFMQFHELDRDRRRAAVRLRLPARDRSRRPRLRLRDPARGRYGPGDARGPGARLRDARRGLQLDASRGRAAPGARVPYGSAPGVHDDRRRPRSRALFRGYLG